MIDILFCLSDIYFDVILFDELLRNRMFNLKCYSYELDKVLSHKIILLAQSFYVTLLII